VSQLEEENTKIGFAKCNKGFIVFSVSLGGFIYYIDRGKKSEQDLQSHKENRDVFMFHEIALQSCSLECYRS
jgi:hypothetical protein